MKTRACLVLSTKAMLAGLTLAAAAAGGCHSAGGKLMVDSPVLPYLKPDISDITGIDEDDDADAAPAATPPAATPAPAAKPSGK